MSNRFFELASAAGSAAVIGIVSLALAPAVAQTPTAKLAKETAANKTWTPPRTPDGQPDLRGVYTNASVIPLGTAQRSWRQRILHEGRSGCVRRQSQGRGKRWWRRELMATFTTTWLSLALTRVSAKFPATLRTSLIVGPEGRVPPLLPAAQARVAARAAANKGHEFDGPENRSLAERCILWPNEGPPMLPEGYNSNLQIVQGQGYVAVMQEMIHDVRIIPTDGRPHLPPEVRQLMGDSRGHWEGNTLVVDTTNFTDRTAFRGSSENLHVVERFTRTDADTVTYQFTVSDPSTWEKSWSGEVLMTKIDGPIFEYACHEGNYGMRE